MEVDNGEIKSFCSSATHAPKTLCLCLKDPMSPPQRPSVFAPIPSSLIGRRFCCKFPSPKSSVIFALIITALWVIHHGTLPPRSRPIKQNRRASEDTRRFFCDKFAYCNRFINFGNTGGGGRWRWTFSLQLHLTAPYAGRPVNRQLP